MNNRRDPLADRISLGSDSSGIPVFITAKELAGRLWGRAERMTLEQLKSEYCISDGLWRRIAPLVGQAYREMSMDPDAVLAAEVNRRLVSVALAVPSLCTRSDLQQLDKLTRESPLPLPAIEEAFFSLVMTPATRALLLCSRCMKVEVSRNLAYLIDSSYLAYARGNIAAAYMAILPCVEGILLRWRGHARADAKAPSISDAADWVLKLRERNPLASLPVFADSWAETCSGIMRNHLYKKTTTGSSFGDFNRHLALHALEDRQYCTPSNLMRAFLLLDLLIELYILEKNLADPRLSSRQDDWQRHAEAYQTASIQALLGGPGVPETALWVHREYDFRPAAPNP